ALDGDADRVTAVSADGRYVDPHRIFAILLERVLAKGRLSGEIAKSFSVSDLIDRICERRRVPLSVTPIGFKHLAEKMRTGRILVAGEESGGIGFHDHIPDRDGLLAGLRLAEAMATERVSLDSFTGRLTELYGELAYDRVDLPISAERLRSLWLALERDPWQSIGGRRVERVERLDGVKFRLRPEGWLLLRASGTEPRLRVYCEAGSEEAVQTILREATQRLLEETRAPASGSTRRSKN
ncbi:MAG: phosphoglucomutase/phosphomannomutase family protein, partial [Vicinamibacteria bacterium]